MSRRPIRISKSRFRDLARPWQGHVRFAGRMTKDAPVGYVKDQLILVTNDTQSRELPVDMEGRVVTDITISPTKWFIGSGAAGTEGDQEPVCARQEAVQDPGRQV